MSTHEQITNNPTSAVRNTGGRNGPQGLEEPMSDEILREMCDKNYHQLLPLIAEKMQKEKEQKDKLNAVKARLIYGEESGVKIRSREESHYSESQTPTARTEPRRRHGDSEEFQTNSLMRIGGLRSDFGLSKVGPTNLSLSSIDASVKGTFGYLDPEYFYTSKVTRKTDVYAFGVVLFELLSGSKQGEYQKWLIRISKVNNDLAKLPKTGKRIVISIETPSQLIWIDKEEFHIEDIRFDLEMFKEFHHPNLIQLIGYCLNREDLLLVWGNIARLPLVTRIKIAVGIARGISFLEKAQLQVRKRKHTNFRSRLDRQNIFVYEDFTVKISGYETPMLVHGFPPHDIGESYQVIEKFTLPSNLSTFIELFTEVLTGKDSFNFKFHCSHKKCLRGIAKSCFKICNEVDAESKMLTLMEKYEKYFPAWGIPSSMVFLLISVIFDQLALELRADGCCWIMDKANGVENTSSTSAQPSRQFTIAEIQSATNNFDDKFVIGQGGFGKVYRGKISIEESSNFVAIKRLDSMSNQGAAEFKAEIEMLSKLRHCNLVSLIGYCDDNREMILVYVYMPRGTLYDHLHKVTDTPLSWIQRLKIAIGAARGLDYLHTGFGTQHGVIHRDVKSSNILLDENWAAMISDFGLSKIGPIDQASNNISVSVKGTFGYLDPEYFYTRKLTRKTDVYAFGVLLFELLSGMLAVDERLGEEHCSLARWAQKCVKERKFDQIVDSTITGTIASKCLRGFAEIANRCLIRDFEKRPSMTQVVAKLQDLLELQEKCDNSADLPGTSGFTWMIRKYRASATNQNSGWHRFPNEHENQGNQGSSRVIGMVAICKKASSRWVWSYERWWIDKTGYSPCMDDTGLPILVKNVDRHILSDLKMLKEFRHPNLVKVIGYYKGETNELVSEFVYNGNFENLLRGGTIRLLPIVDGDYHPGFPSITPQTMIFSSFRSVFTEVLTGRNFSLEEFHKINNSLHKDGKQSLGLVAKLCYENCNNIDSEQMDFTVKISGYETPMLVHGFPPHDIGESYQVIEKFTLPSNLSTFIELFTEVLTGKDSFNFKFHCSHKKCLRGIAKSCFKICNEVDAESKMLTLMEKYEKYFPAWGIPSNNYKTPYTGINHHNLMKEDMRNEECTMCMVFMVIFFGVIFIWIMNKANVEAENLTSSTSAQPSRRFTIAEIQSATNNFDDELVIGQGGFGKVYKGQISIEESSHFVAIKRLGSMSNQGTAEFKAEIEMLSKLRHCNLVSLIGYCDDNREMILIAIGAARGLDYLHTGFGTKHGVIHRDVKSSNILLDENWAAMISDFGLSKIGPIDQASNNISVSVKGTFGYLDPEYFYTRKLTRKTDVYAFGVLLVELLSGMLAVDERLVEEHCSFARWAQKCVKERKFDQTVDSTITGTIAPKCLRGFAEIANRCLIRDFEKRPSMTQVVAKLQDLLELQEKCDNSADSPGTSGFTWMISKYRASATNQNSGQGGTGFPKSSENHMNQGSSVYRDGGDIGKKPPEHGELVAGDIKVFTYDELKTAILNFEYPAIFCFDSKKQWRINNTGYSPCMDDTGLPILVKIVDSHILSDLRMLKEFRHPNLVNVIGYFKGKTNLLVSEFVHNGNFEDLLRGGTIGLLPLATKVKIAVGIARGIVYLCNTTNNAGKLSCSSRYSGLWNWDHTICTFKLNNYMILLDEDFTAKLLEYDITKLVGYYDNDKRDPQQYHITGLVDVDYYPGFSPREVDITLQTKIFSSFRSVFTEVLTGRNFSFNEFHNINYWLHKDEKQSLGLVAKLCYENCNTIDSEQMMLKYFEEYENYIHM
ncbi:probable receptor-like protein kinase isoform X1 [Tanacetum coccineum]